VTKVAESIHRQSPEIQALLNAHPSGIDQIYTSSYGVIEHLITKMGGTKDDAQDIFQQSLMVIYQKSKAPSFQLTCSFQTFLYAVSKNLWRDQLKKKHRKEVTLDETVQSISESVVEESIHHQNRQSFYQEKFRLLSEDCQRLLKMYFDRMSMRDIAAKMNTTEGYIRKKKHGCKKTLIDKMQADPLFEELKHS